MFTIPNLFTALNLTSGVLAIFSIMIGRIEFIPWLLGFALLCDFLDGFLARILNQKSEMGKQLDSLADMVTFGVVPGLLMMTVMVMNIGRYARNPYGEEIQYDLSQWVYEISYGTTDYYLPLIALLIPVMSMFRLAKFNIDERQSSTFIGLPTPAHTILYLFYPLVIVYDSDYLFERWDLLFILFDPNFIAGVIVLFSFLLVSNIPLFSLKISAFNPKSHWHQMSFLLISFVLIALLSFWAVPLIVFLYLILSLIVNAINKKGNEIQSGN